MIREMKSLKGHMESLDRTSELPEFILHLILSFLKTEEACRTSILSKQWYNAWVSMPILYFHPRDFEKLYATHWYDEGLVQAYVGFIDKTMQRYSEQKYFIKKFRLEFPKVDEKVAPFIDKWVGIAVQNKVEELNLNMVLPKSPKYRLPETVFCAKSLKVLNSSNVVLPYYGTMKLHSLKCVNLMNATIDESMLQRILSLCPLIDLKLRFCSDLESISIPWTRNNLYESGKSLDHTSLQFDVKASALQDIIYWSEFSWPCEMNVYALRNLRKLEICFAPVTDDIVSFLASKLSSLDSLTLSSCTMLKNIEILSKQLKKFVIVECDELEKATIDAPNLLSFVYNGQPEPSLSIINVQVNCDGHLYVLVESISIKWFISLKEFLTKSKIFKVMEMNLSECTSQIELGEDKLELVGPPYKLRELKLHETSYWMLTESSLSAFLDGLFWSCHPDVLTVQTTINFQTETVELLLEALKNKVKCWRHALKHIEAEEVDFSGLLSCSELEIRFRLHW